LTPRELYRAAIVVLGVLFVGLGLALIVVTAREGGGVGYLLGFVFVAVGVGRLVLVRRR
jgi:hypothetical protein